MTLRIILFVLLACGAHALAQAPLAMIDEPYQLDSGVHSNTDTEYVAAFTGVVLRPDAVWLRVHLEAELGRGSYVTLTSMLDGQEQSLDAATLAAWSDASAGFMGDSVQLVLYVAPGDSDVFVRVTGVTLPLYQFEPTADVPETICGSNDDRIPSSDPAVGRLLASGCTGWLVSNGAVLTAGHCGVAVGDFLEFNVPASSANGVPVLAATSDQYPITAINAVQNIGVGEDWQLLAVGPSSMGGPTPQVVQGFYRMVQTTPANGTTVRVTGYGLDNTPGGPGNICQGGANQGLPCSSNAQCPGGACMVAACCNAAGSGCQNNCNATSQTEQTTTGPFNGLSGGNTHSYAVDTMPANSGSPIIWEAFQVTIGIHTDGGCTSSGGNNQGTAFNATPLRDALQAFAGTNAVYVDGGISGLPQNGGIFEPYTNVGQAVSAVLNGGTISMVTGSYAAADGNLFTAGADGRAITFQAPVGVVTIGN